MSVLGIITCEVLEQEFAYILSSDTDLGRVTVIKNIWSDWLARAIEERLPGKVVLIPHMKAFISEPTVPLEVVVFVLEFALHRNRRVLQKAVAQAAREMGPHIHALLLGYGLCGNAFFCPEELLDVSVPIFFPAELGHPVDDCVGMLIGGRERYYSEQRQVPGTFFMTPGWTRHWKRLFSDTRQGRNDQALKRLFTGYKRCLLIRTPVMQEDAMRENTSEFCNNLGLYIDICDGTLNLLNSAWLSAKQSLVR
ncbi:MAG: DUF1638 domain-containing protein [Methanospirillaceae archaeon]|nr:DUF1638 domain-containing protein [Methanospirillaceae archaeon]